MGVVHTDEIIERGSVQLPDTLEDLTQFVLVGKAKLQAYMLKLQTVNRLSTAQEIRDQTLKEAQEISTALIAAEQRIGELLLAIPKQAGASNFSRDEEKLKTKGETIKEMGYGKNEASGYQQMAKNPEIVQKVIEDALANGEVVTKAQVLKEIKAAKDELAEKDRKIKELEKDGREREDYILELESKEPEVKTVEKIVPPADYEDLKKKAKEASAYKQDFKREQSKVTEKQKKILELESELEELKRASMEGLDSANLSENIFYFCTICNNFIGNVGGLVWLTDRIADMPTKEREMFLKAANSFMDWSMAFKNNLERRLTDEERGTGANNGIPALTHKE